MKFIKPCKTLEEAQAYCKEDEELAIDSKWNDSEFSDYVMAVVSYAFSPIEYPYIVWKEL